MVSRTTIGFALVLLGICSANLCYLGKQPDPNHSGKLRWVLPYIEEIRCSCTKVLFGGVNTVAPLGAENHFYTDTPLLFVNNDDANSLRDLMGCPEVNVTNEVATDLSTNNEGSDDRSNEQECARPLGMENGTIVDASINASSFYPHSNWNRVPQYARLNGAKFWTNNNNDKNSWIQVDLLAQHNVTGLLTQGSPIIDDAYWVTVLQVKTGTSLETLAYIYKKTNGPHKDFKANTCGHNEIATIKFEEAVVAQFVRIYPINCASSVKNNHPLCVLRFEIIGC